MIAQFSPLMIQGRWFDMLIHRECLVLATWEV